MPTIVANTLKVMWALDFQFTAGAGGVSLMARYREIRQIGRGGFATVFLCEDKSGRHVALKRPRDGVPHAVERLSREVKVARMFAHENVMPVLDFKTGDSPWFTMPVAEGNIKELDNRGVLSEDRESVAVGVFCAVAEGLRAPHDEGFVHRDISLGNILGFRGDTTDSRRWVIADWGLVRRPLGLTTQKLTNTGIGFGTPGFGAPETWDDAHQVDPRADIYSLGRVVAWLLTRQQPRDNLPLLPTGNLRGFVAACTEPDPTRRPRDMQAALDLLDASIASPAAVAPRFAVRKLVQSGAGPAALSEIRPLVRQNMHDDKLFIDELANVREATLKAWTKVDPSEAADVAICMSRFLLSADWGKRSFDYANTVLGFSFSIVTQLVTAREFDLAEDVATAFFEAEAQWDRYSQLGRTRPWLESLTGKGGQAIARAIRRSGTHEYYRAQMSGRRLASPELDEQIGG
ncbi:serine/threonine-protein kinase [Nocardia aurea]|uniref:non-specific serine/threonine protein kinase n=1 Tax=Nocardia aurea TaxID=2144174 RepID=A0ABV3G4V9_9NOCA